MATMTRTLPEDEDTLRRSIDAMHRRQKVAFAAGYAQRLLIIFDGRRDGVEHRHAYDRATIALEILWSVADGADHQTDELAHISDELLALIPDDDDPNFTWSRTLLGDILRTIVHATGVASNEDTTAAVWARRVFTDYLDLIVQRRSPAGYIEDLEHCAFFQTAIALIDEDVASSANPAMHRKFTTAQGTQLLSMVSTYLGSTSD